ncbi:MAG TPA: TAXI family TRAP transporter solute-binding subunit, partial [Gemmatimonadaceae bacterium]|nr:TAXI family TRAP transporter solute-binding subunit [Gemmatimonadaceae bacterium]
GTPGSGTQEMVARILRAVGMDPDRDIVHQGLGVGAAAEALKDGKVDALFWSSGYPNGAILDLANTPGERLRLLPSVEALPALQRSYGASLYFELAIPRAAYPGLDADVPTVGVATVLVADARMDAELAYEITRALFEHRDELIAVHEIARELTLASAVERSPAPYHPGAVRYYRERGAWPG